MTMSTEEVMKKSLELAQSELDNYKRLNNRDYSIGEPSEVETPKGMVKVNVQEADELILDWLVAKALGERVGISAGKPCYFTETWEDGNEDLPIPNFTTDPEESYPIIESEGIQSTLVYTNSMRAWQCFYSSAELPIGDGPTQLIAAMRCFVAGKLGYEVLVPEMLIQITNGVRNATT